MNKKVGTFTRAQQPPLLAPSLVSKPNLLSLRASVPAFQRNHINGWHRSLERFLGKSPVTPSTALDSPPAQTS